MKLYASISNENRKSKSMGGNEHLDIDILVGNTNLASLTLRYSDELPEQDGSGWVLYDHNDNPLFWIEDTKGKNKIDCGCKQGVFTCREHYIKGKQKKDGKCYCSDNDMSIPHHH